MAERPLDTNEFIHLKYFYYVDDDRVIVAHAKLATPVDRAVGSELYGQHTLFLSDTEPPDDVFLQRDGGWLEHFTGVRYQLYPDESIKPHLRKFYVPRIVKRIYDTREEIAASAIDLPHESDASYSSALGDIDQLTGLFVRSLLHRSDPSLPFRRILIPRRHRDTLSEAGLHEVRSMQELEHILRERLDRHNAAHNAQLEAMEELKPLVQAVSDMFDQTPAECPFYEPSVPAVNALTAFADSVEERVRQLAEPGRHERPGKSGLTTMQIRAIERLEAKAAERLSALTGMKQTWLNVLAVGEYDLSGLRGYVLDGHTKIASSSTQDAVDASERDASTQIDAWRPPFSVALSHQPAGDGRGVDISLVSTAPILARVSMAHYDTPSAPSKPLVKTSDADYTIGDHNTQWARPGFPATFPLRVTGGPTDRVWVARITASLGDGGIAVYERDYTIGAV